MSALLQHALVHQLGHLRRQPGCQTQRQGVHDAQPGRALEPQWREVDVLADLAPSVHLGGGAVQLGQDQLDGAGGVGGRNLELQFELVAHELVDVPAAALPLAALLVAFYAEPLRVVLLAEAHVLDEAEQLLAQPGGPVLGVGACVDGEGRDHVQFLAAEHNNGHEGLRNLTKSSQAMPWHCSLWSMTSSMSPSVSAPPSTRLACSSSSRETKPSQSRSRVRKTSTVLNSLSFSRRRLPIMAMNSSNSMVSLPSVSISLRMSLSSSWVTVMPREKNISSSSALVMQPSLSLSNSRKARLASFICSSVKLQDILFHLSTLKS